jgi:O-antigen/teichoic acid export membrane protein
VLEVFGRSYTAGYPVMVILGFSMLLATVCGQVDMVLITSGRSSWSLANGLLTVGINVGLDIVLIPRYGILGAAIGWAVAIAVSNLMPLTQLAKVLGLHPFGRGTVIACAVSVVNFGLVPLALRSVLGPGPAALAASVAVGALCNCCACGGSVAPCTCRACLAGHGEATPSGPADRRQQVPRRDR